MQFRHKMSCVLIALAILIPVFGVAHAQDATGCEAGFHLFESDLLTTDPLCIPEAPQRIAAVDTFTFETLLALGIKPVSGPFIETFLRDHTQFTDAVEGVIDTDFPVNRESLLSANPDLIISIQPWISEIYDDLSSIAPTVSIRYDGDNAWQAVVNTVGVAINQQDALDAGFAAYNDRLTTFKSLTEAAPVGDVAIVFLLPDQLYPFMNTTFSGQILEDAGLNFPAALVEAAAGGDLTDISAERLDLLGSAEHIFVVTSGFSDEDLAQYAELIATLEANPLWNTLPAVQADNVHIVGRDWLGSSLVAANVVVDDLLEGIHNAVVADVSPDPFLPAAEATPEVTETSAS